VSINPGGGPNRLAENLLGLEAGGYAPDSITDSAIVDLAEAQTAGGSWNSGEEQPRPPITEGDIAGTAAPERRDDRARQDRPLGRQWWHGRVPRHAVVVEEPRALSARASEILAEYFGATWRSGVPPSTARGSSGPLYGPFVRFVRVQFV
jgi:hypothetical protein